MTYINSYKDQNWLIPQSRKLAGACRENFVFMYLAEKVQPNFRTIARFRIRGIEKAKIELNLISITHNLKKIWIARGKLSIDNKNIIFDLIIKNNQMYCSTACIGRQFF